MAGTSTHAAPIRLDASDETILLCRRLVDPLASLGEQLLLLATQYANPNDLECGTDIRITLRHN